MSGNNIVASSAYGKTIGMNVVKSNSKVPSAYKGAKTKFMQMMGDTNHALKTGVIPPLRKDKLSVGSLAMDKVQKARKSVHSAENYGQKALFKKANMVDVVTSVNEASLAVKTIVKIRDAVIDAYNDISKMPI